MKNRILNLQLNSLKSRIAQRLFLLLFLVILLPILITGIVSYRYVDDLILERQKESLKKASKEYGLGLFERFKNAQDYLDIALSGAIENLSYTEAELSRLQRHFKVVEIYKNSDLQKSPIEGAISRSIWERHKKSPDSRILTTVLSQNQRSIFIIEERVYQGDVYTGLGEINLDFFWPSYELNAYEMLCVVNERVEFIHCLHELPENAIKKLKEHSQSTFINWVTQDGLQMMASSWSLFMKHRFNAPDIVIVISKPLKIVLSPLEKFKNSFVPGIFLAFLFILFFTLLSVRRHLIPLEKLIHGTKQIADNNYRHKVNIDSDDEYQALAESFNSMTAKLSSESDVNEALNTINKNVLLHKEISECARTILSGLEVLSAPSMACIYILDTYLQAGPAVYKSDFKNELFASDFEYPTEWEPLFLDIELLGAQLLSGQKLKSLIGESWIEETDQYWLYPIFREKTLLAVILLASKESDSEQHHPRLNEYLSHVSVVLNALRHEKVLAYQANYDELTGLTSRSFFAMTVSRQLKGLNASSNTAALISIDLDRFKTVNDTLGHQVGDTLLTHVATRISEALPEGAIAARFGGDEFLAFLPNREHAYLEVIANSIIVSLARKFQLGDYNANIGGSIGISFFPENGRDFESLLKSADIALYSAKSDGRGCFAFYTDKLDREFERRSTLEGFLSDVIETEGLSLVYQPKVDIRNGRLSGFEVLSRFIHPELGFIPPQELYEIAEQTGFVNKLGGCVLNRAMEQQKKWFDMGVWQGHMAINISPVQLLDATFVDQLDRAITKSGVRPSDIELEITESIFIGNYDEISEKLDGIRSRGISIAIDDFGTGYSSLALITQLPIDHLKIDRAFILQIEQGEKFRKVFKSIIEIAQHLEIKTTAEGIETVEHLRFVSDCDCEDIQGYLYSKPLSCQEAEEILRKPEVDKFMRPISNVKNR